MIRIWEVIDPIWPFTPNEMRLFKMDNKEQAKRWIQNNSYVNTAYKGIHESQFPKV